MMFVKYVKSAVFSVIAALASPALAEESTFDIYIDADYSISSAAARSIELGVRTALGEVDYELAGTKVRILAMDHRANVKRARRTYGAYLTNPAALAVIGGLHSPPYLANRDFINESGVLTLLPWSAAGPITRSSAGHENWIFRLSVDDTLSGGFLVHEAVERAGCENLALILLENGWGRANQKTLTAALAERNMVPVATEFFSASISEASAHSLAARLGRSGADCGVLLSNWDDGALVLNAIHQSGTNLRMFSHWGIMGGHFTERVDNDTRSALELRVLQTCGLRREQQGSAVLSAALHRAKPIARSLSDVEASTGFVHAYDLTRILIQAATEASETERWVQGDIGAKRRALRNALEQLQGSVPGILNTYDTPFQPFDASVPDAHEALGADDLCMAQFGPDGRLEDAF